LGATVVIKAGTTHAEVAGDAGLQKAIPGLAALAGGIGDPHVRHKGTIGGSVANNDPAADYPSACMALGATIHTTGPQDPGGPVLHRHVLDRAGRDARS
jgi:aerobic carbon-monoxide dehydrogenase medium subunit